MAGMAEVLHLHRVLTERPLAPDGRTVGVRTYHGTEDIDEWLEIRQWAFARERVGVGRWTREDFKREFLAKPWWSPEHMWFAVAREPASGAEKAVGTVTLARRGMGPDSRPVIHWLAVLPAWRRRGVGQLLVRTLEIACWEAGDREILLETHASWEKATALYEALGYVRSR
jgi:GNAT superfamily N-acetyltransferase